MNKARLEMLAAHLEKLPRERFDMGNWCGTACCIGGHARKLFKLPVDENGGYDTGAFFGLTRHQVDRLFFPVHYAAAYGADNQQAADVVRCLSETGRVNWPRFVS